MVHYPASINSTAPLQSSFPSFRPPSVFCCHFRSLLIHRRSPESSPIAQAAARSSTKQDQDQDSSSVSAQPAFQVCLLLALHASNPKKDFRCSVESQLDIADTYLLRLWGSRPEQAHQCCWICGARQASGEVGS